MLELATVCVFLNRSIGLILARINNSIVFQVCESVKQHPKRGDPRILSTQQNGVATTIILASGGTRILYDVIPVVSFRGWPAVAMGWLQDSHFWDGILPEEEGSKAPHNLVFWFKWDSIYFIFN